MSASGFGVDAPSASGFFVDRVRFYSPNQGNTTTAPDPPASFTVTADSNDPNVTFTWGAPASDGGSAITGFTVRVYAGTLAAGTPVRSFPYPATTSAATETLNPATTYAFTITATNAAGESIERPSTPQSVTTGSTSAIPVVSLVTQYCGGFQNCGVLLDPSVHGPDICITGSDVGGMYQSSDRGKTFLGVNSHVKMVGDRMTRGVYAHPTTAGRVYAVRRSGTQVVYASSDHGKPGTWSLQTTNAFGSGGETVNQPRTVGKIGLCVTSNGKLRHYVACDGGIFRSDDDAKTFPTNLGPSGEQCTGVAVDPQNPTTILATSTNVHKATSAGGLWLITNADGANGTTPTITQIKHGGTAFTDGEEVVSVVNPATQNTEFYCAMGTNGVWRLEITNSTKPASNYTLTNITGSTMPSLGGGWVALDAIASGTKVYLVLVGGTASAKATGSTIWRHLNAGANAYTDAAWFDCIKGGSVNKKIINNTGENWWLYAGDTSWLPTGSQWDVGSVSFYPGDPNSVRIFGRSTVSGYDNFLAASPAFYCFPVGIGMLDTQTVSFSSKTPLAGMIVSTDWERTVTNTTTPDGFVTVQPLIEHVGSAGSAWSGFVDAQDHGYVGSSKNNNGGTSVNGGRVSYLTNFITDSGSDLGIDADLGKTGNLGSPKSLIAIYDSSNVRHLVVHFQSYGSTTNGLIVHKQGTNAASIAKDLGAGNGGNYRSRMAWQTDANGNPTGVVFLHEQSTGIWRSSDSDTVGNSFGRGWVNIYPLSDKNKNNDWLRVLGSVACVPGTTDLYFITYEGSGSTAYKLPNANSIAVSNVATKKAPIATNINQPAQIGYSPDSGRLYIAESVFASDGAKLYESDAGLATLTDVTPQGWADSVVFPVNMFFGNSRLYMATDAQGAWHVKLPLS